eukprot:7330220-Pyramimonas_sp.AAC.1
MSTMSIGPDAAQPSDGGNPRALLGVPFHRTTILCGPLGSPESPTVLRKLDPSPSQRPRAQAR